MKAFWWLAAGTGLAAGLIIGGAPGGRVGWASWAWWQVAQRDAGRAWDRFLQGPRHISVAQPGRPRSDTRATSAPASTPAAPSTGTPASAPAPTTAPAPSVAGVPTTLSAALAAVTLPVGWDGLPGPTRYTHWPTLWEAHRDNGQTYPAYWGMSVVVTDGPAFYGASWPADAADPERMALPGATVTPLSGRWRGYTWYDTTATGPQGQPESETYGVDWVAGNFAYEVRITEPYTLNPAGNLDSAPFQTLVQTQFLGRTLR